MKIKKNEEAAEKVLPKGQQQRYKTSAALNTKWVLSQLLSPLLVG